MSFVVNGDLLAAKVEPSATGGSATGTGMYLSGTNELALSTADVRRVQVTSTGLVATSSVSTTTTPVVSLEIQGTDAMKLPAGTTAERPSPATNGMLRYNTNTNFLEYYDATLTQWVSISPPNLFATGGTVTTAVISGTTYRIHQFTTPGTSSFDVLYGAGEVEYLVVGGGGGGSGSTSGGGGAGGYRCSVIGESSGGGSAAEPRLFVNQGSYTVTVGLGGNSVPTQSEGNNGEPSVFHTITANGGGRGAGSSGALVNGWAATSGGSGGGGMRYASKGAFAGAAGTAGQGFAGGTFGPDDIFTSGGGGGAGAVGNAGAANASGGIGGVGVSSSITGTAVFRGGGGGAGKGEVSFPNCAGGAGGGGAGANTTQNATSGTANTGGGGGGGWSYASGTGGGGGSGIVIIRYPI